MNTLESLGKQLLDILIRGREISKEILEQILGLLNGLTEKEIAKLHRKTRSKKVKLSAVEEQRLRQGSYKVGLRTGELLYGKRVR